MIRAAGHDAPAVCVMCGARDGSAPMYTDAARELGSLLAAHGYTVVYGGARIGTMGVLADAALAGGGRVEGVIPRALLEYGIDHRGLASTRFVPDIATQQAVMLERASAFVCLPGGLGTFAELSVVLSHAQLAFHAKPILVANVQRYYDPLLTMLARAVKRGFASAPDLGLLQAFDRVADLVKALSELDLDASAGARRRHERRLANEALAAGLAGSADGRP